MVSNLVRMPQSELTEAFTLAAVDAVDLLRKLSDGREAVNQNHIGEIQTSLSQRFAEMYFHVHPRVKHLQPVKVSLPERDPMQDILTEAGYELLRLRQDERCQQMGGGG